MGICLTACNKTTSAVRHSDLFVPSFEMNVSVRSQKKKLLKFGSMKDDYDNNNTFYKLNKITTEKIIRAKSMRKIKHNSTSELHSSRQILPNILKNKFELENESLHDSFKATDKINTNSKSNRCHTPEYKTKKGQNKTNQLLKNQKKS